MHIYIHITTNPLILKQWSLKLIALINYTFLLLFFLLKILNHHISHRLKLKKYSRNYFREIKKKIKGRSLEQQTETVQLGRSSCINYYKFLTRNIQWSLTIWLHVHNLLSCILNVDMNNIQIFSFKGEKIKWTIFNYVSECQRNSLVVFVFTQFNFVCKHFKCSIVSVAKSANVDSCLHIRHFSFLNYISFIHFLHITCFKQS